MALCYDQGDRRALCRASQPQLGEGQMHQAAGIRDRRLEEIRRTWMEKLDDSQIERRGDGSASRTLRRFPERRETA